MKICLDPGHGLGNVRRGVYDTGAEAAGETEAAIVMTWANELSGILMAAGHEVVRTRKDAGDAAPVGLRAGIARQYGCEVFLSLHCNAADGHAQGTETYYRGEGNAALARAVNEAVVRVLGTRDRGIKTESESQHSRLAVLNFPRAVLLEIGFIDHAGDRGKLLDAGLRKAACEALAGVLAGARE